ncbi:MAG: hypothetical protein HC896_03160 [Bacteroidales bacterium]|nr:hypothetical protein [Bacteroidales bacterium]
MDNVVLKSIMRLFAISANIAIQINYIRARGIVESFLDYITDQTEAQEYLVMFDFHFNQFKNRNKEIASPKDLSVLSIKTVLLCEEVGAGLLQHQKFFLLIHLLEVLHESEEIDSDLDDFGRTIGEIFKINNEEYAHCRNFIFNRKLESNNSPHFLLIDDNEHEDGQNKPYSLAGNYGPDIVFAHSLRPISISSKHRI